MKKALKTTGQRRSPLLDSQNLNSKKAKKRSSVPELALALPLTSLIDAFSIIVIYLLIGTQSGGGVETSISKQMKLPSATHAVNVTKEMAILKIEKGHYFLNEKSVTAQNLTSALTMLKQSSADKNIELMIQADQTMVFADLDPLIKAGSLAGIEKLKFAVVPE